MAAVPLTHHEILTLVEPFTRRSRHVDLSASDRAARKLAFKPVEVGGDSPQLPRLRDALLLDCGQGGRFVLTRVLSHPDGVEATLKAAGTDLVALLAKVEAVDPQRQFERGDGYLLSRSYEYIADETRGAADALFMTRGVATFDGLTLAFNLLAVRSVPGDITLEPAPGARLELPEDLLAVLGWDWARLVAGANGWSSKIRLRGNSPRRGRTAERALDAAARHVARVLAEAPRRFHERYYWSRWGVVLRRSIPTLTAVLLIVGALLLPKISDKDLSGVWLALHYVPIAILAVSFSLQELARFEIPRWPTRPQAATWRLAPAVAAVEPQ